MKPNAIETELLRIAEEHGGILQPESVVDEARDKKSPLHSRFTWDDTEAAEQYRLWQARQLIRVVVHMIPGKNGNVSSRVFVSLKTDRAEDGGGYRTMAVVLSDSEMREQLLAEAIAEMEYFREKYSRLKELAGVFKAMRSVRQKATRKKAA